MFSAGPLAGVAAPEATGDPGLTRWTMVNVCPGQAQADCHVIEFPDGTVVLIDPADAADAPGTALAYLQQRHIERLDLVVISHFHLDHYGRLADFIKAGIKIGRVAINLPADRGIADREKPWGCDWDHVQSVLGDLRARGIPTFTPQAGDRLVDIGTAQTPIRLEVVCLYDGRDSPFDVTNVNDTSIILRLVHGPTRALFAGDAGPGLGRYLAASVLDLSADILKVPHHGMEAHPSDEFYDRVQPKVALVPVSSSLWLGNPRSQRARLYFTAHSVPVYVSGLNGHVTVEFDARGYAIRPQHPPLNRPDHAP